MRWRAKSNCTSGASSTPGTSRTSAAGSACQLHVVPVLVELVDAGVLIAVTHENVALPVEGDVGRLIEIARPRGGNRLTRSHASAADALLDRLVSGLSSYSVFRVMSAETYFRGGGLPWLGLLASSGLSVAVLYAATANLARRDF